MLNFLKNIFYKIPLFLQDLLRPIAKWFYYYICMLFSHDVSEEKAYQKNIDLKSLYIPVNDMHLKIKDKFLLYKHKFIIPPPKKQFRNCFLSNDYSEIEERAQAWDGKPILKASIIVASYNQKDTLKLNLLAWTQQTYPKGLIEVIVADDGSSDGTEALVEELKKKLDYKIKFFTQEDKGFRVAKVRNEGVALSEGEVVFFVDADTIPSSEYIQEHMKYYHVSDEVAVVGMRQRIEAKINEDTVLHKHTIESLKKLPMIEDKDAPERVRSWRKNILFNNMEFRKEPRAWGGFHGTLGSCRKCDYLGVGGSDESFTAYGQEDSELGFRLLAKVRYLVSNPKACLFHLEHPGSPYKISPLNVKMLKDKTKGPKVTVYIPVHNSEKYIEESIQSVLKQTLEDFELIIVNDGSTDNTGQILEKYRYHPKVRIYSQSHKGKGAASNLALLYARGECICNLDSNDLLLPDALEILSKELDQNRYIGFVYAGHYNIKNGEKILVNPPPYKPGAFLLFQNTSFPKIRIWRKFFFIQTEGFNEKLLTNVDYDISLKLEEICYIKEVSTVLYQSIIHSSDSAPISQQITLKDTVKVLNFALQRRRIALRAEIDKQNEIFFKCT